MPLGYSAGTVSVAGVQDSYVTKPCGNVPLAIQPTVPAAIAQTSADTGSEVPYYTKSSSTVLVLNLPSTPTFTSSSRMGVFWTTSGTNYYCLDCTISISTDAVTITAPTVVPTGQTNFTTITAGTTVVTFSLATLTSVDTPNNPDSTDFIIPSATMQQLILSCPGGTGAFELFATPIGTLSDSADGAWVESTKTLTPSTAPGWVAGALVGLAVSVNGTSVGTIVSNTTTALVTTANGSVSNGNYAWAITSPNLVLSFNYTAKGDFYNWNTGAAAPFAGNATSARFYNSSLAPIVMSIGALSA
jgi:hypothetical protein